MPAALILDAAIALFKRYKALILAAPLLLALAVQTARIEGFLWIDGYKEKLAARDKTIADFVKAQEAAKAAQDAADKGVIDTQLEANRKLEEAHNENERLRAGAVARYVADNRVRQVNHCPSSGAAPAVVYRDTGQAAGNEVDPGMVAIAEPDLNSLTEAALQNAERGAFLNGLIDQGLGVRASEVD